jgi:hypothetical protein
LLSTNHLPGATVAAASWDRPAAEIARWSAGTAAGLLLTAALLVAWRRLAGALVSPLEPPVLLAVAALLAATTGGVRLVWRRCSPDSRLRRGAAPLGLLLSAAVLALGASLSLPGSDARALLAFWTLLVAEECWAWWPTVWRQRHRAAPTGATPRPVRLDLPETSAPHAIPPESTADAPAAEILQQLTRSRAANGADQLAGWLRTRFSAGQRTGSIHVAFCPPFAKTPELAVVQHEGPEARIKTAQLLPYGARLDLKLAAAAEQPASVLLHFSARSADNEIERQVASPFGRE